jgi:cell division septation protein DedD
MLSRQCVIVPGLGAVLSQSVSARYDKETGAWLPPMRSFSFNSELTNNDGTLAASIARAEGVSYEKASRKLSEAVDAMRHQLEVERRLSLGRIGELTLDEHRKINFEPYDAERLSPAAMWLPALNIKTIAERRIEAEAEENANNGERRGVLARTARRLKVAAVIICLIAIGAVLTIPLHIENAQYASLGIEKFTGSDSKPALIERPGATKQAAVLMLNHYDDAVTIVDTVAYNRQRAELKAGRPQAAEPSAEPNAASDVTAAKPAQATQTTATATDGRYCLVIASLTTQAEADEYVAKHGDANLGVLAKDGRYRVYAVTGNSIADVQAKAANLGKRYPDAWVCRR